MGLIPKSWTIGRIGDLAINRTKTVKPEEITSGTKYIGLEHIPRKRIILNNFGVSDDLESQKLMFHEGDILFGKLRPYFHKVTIAPFDGVCSTDILSINSKISDYYGYLIFQLFSDRLIEYVTLCSNGTKMPRTNWKDISNYKIAIPPSELANKYTTIIREFISLMKKNVYENMSLSKLRDTLLPKLMSGEIRVPVEQEQARDQIQDQKSSIYQPSYNDLPLAAESKADYQA